MRKFDSFLNGPYQIKFIKRLFGLGVLLISSVLGYKFFGSASAELKGAGYSVSWKADVGPEMIFFYVGAVCVFISIFFYWRYLERMPRTAFGGALLGLVQSGLAGVSDYSLQLAVKSDYNFQGDPNFIRAVMSGPEPLSGMYDYRSGRSYLDLVQGRFVLKDAKKADFNAKLSTWFYFLLGPLALVFFQFGLFLCVEKQWGDAAASFLAFFCLALLAWSALTTYSSISAARRLAK
ncbi:hypothetical protein [Pseudomonas sp. P7548]|uniref:hypothetical protein n=1 Tax=Pseudomonas sp. P7548 TaxID=2726981 RepID=UPI0015BE78F6|nr:hypothetical protein [Pseudomonas sp. P7548]NWE21168.1 hypothetical protein [Pseudomonas sp. P7548]